ncbi:hypothetical protein BHC48_04670 [Snodgrassella communis]|uniref:Uncharacterized protein n=1 Tax=Snodgrassella alvi TaxID=1196083 RepID=A0A2N9XRG9_9NEIS|nr:hypothetical protein BHC48_04670 [Snodgrassella communis]
MCLQTLLQEHAKLALTAKSPDQTEYFSQLFSDKFHLTYRINHAPTSKENIELKYLLEYEIISFTKNTNIRHNTNKIIELFRINLILAISPLTIMTS